MRPGAGRRRYTYSVPDRLADLEPGEAVLVEFGRRQALGIVLGPAGSGPPGASRPKPIVDRVRADGPLLPPLEPGPRRLDRRHVPRAARGRPPGDAAAGDPRAARARRRAPPGAAADVPATTDAADEPTALDAADGPCSTSSPAGRCAVRDLAAPEGRAGLLRRLRALAARGLDRPRLDAARGDGWAALRALGRARRRPARAAATLRAGGRPPGRPLGPRQRRPARRARRPDPTTGLPAAPLAGRHGTSALAGLVRRGLAAVDVRERPRRPLDARPAGVRGGRPPVRRR